jgi:ketosteroid isomerase-like protein
MSQENVEIVRGMYRQEDPGRFFELLDEEVEVDASAVGLLPDHSGLVHGKDAVVEYFRHYWGTWDADYVLEPVEIIDVGRDRVVVLHHERGRGRASGTPFERQWAVLYTLRAGKLIRWTTYATHQEALEAAGLLE